MHEVHFIPICSIGPERPAMKPARRVDWFALSRAELPKVIRSDEDAAQLHTRLEQFSATRQNVKEMTHEELVFLQELFILPEVEELRNLFRLWFSLTPEEDSQEFLDYHYVRKMLSRKPFPSHVPHCLFMWREDLVRGFVANLLLRHYGLAIYHGRGSQMTRAEKRQVRKATVMRLAFAKSSFVLLTNKMISNEKLPLEVLLIVRSLRRKMLPVQFAPGPVPDRIREHSKYWLPKHEARYLDRAEDPWLGLPTRENLVSFLPSVHSGSSEKPE